MAIYKGIEFELLWTKQHRDDTFDAVFQDEMRSGIDTYLTVYGDDSSAESIPRCIHDVALRAHGFMALVTGMIQGLMDGRGYTQTPHHWLCKVVSTFTETKSGIAMTTEISNAFFKISEKLKIAEIPEKPWEHRMCELNYLQTLHDTPTHQYVCAYIITPGVGKSCHLKGMIAVTEHSAWKKFWLKLCWRWRNNIQVTSFTVHQ